MLQCRLYLIEILHQTTTAAQYFRCWIMLYLIEILHQTTTRELCVLIRMELYLIEILHQTTTSSPRSLHRAVVSYRNSTSNHNLMFCCMLQSMVVSYRNSTSNHNIAVGGMALTKLYLIEILHQTTTHVDTVRVDYSCILSKFYIKPQQRIRHKIGHSVVSYRNSTSNHNRRCQWCIALLLYLIEILHQTTTTAGAEPRNDALYLIEILHQTTTGDVNGVSLYCCILSKFYIKPQPEGVEFRRQSGCILSKFYIKPQRRASY